MSGALTHAACKNIHKKNPYNVLLQVAIEEALRGNKEY